MEVIIIISVPLADIVGAVPLGHLGTGDHVIFVPAFVNMNMMVWQRPEYPLLNPHVPDPVRVAVIILPLAKLTVWAPVTEPMGLTVSSSWPTGLVKPETPLVPTAPDVPL